jgi:protein-S-isoprenylcysteine O-methyltransferase Ste14
MALLAVGIGMRIHCEELLILKVYPEYGEYAKHTKRVIPFVF